jgi:hypothetical protein
VGKHFREEMEMALEQALHNAGPVFLMRIQTLLSVSAGQYKRWEHE